MNRLRVFTPGLEWDECVKQAAGVECIGSGMALDCGGRDMDFDFESPTAMREALRKIMALSQSIRTKIIGEGVE